MRYEKKMNRYERTEFQKKKLAISLAGEGRYLFRNNTSGSLMLPKADLAGLRTVEKNGTFEGDSYFMAMVKTHELRLIREVAVEPAPQPEGEVVMLNEEQHESQDQLILDQPATVTEKGVVEHHVVPVKGFPKKKNEKHDKGGPKDVLFVEEPLDGVDILVD